jgi:DNA invertase Pin-like site-specific DNA recombinase
MTDLTATPRVYSYVRFSTPEQALGDSKRRQVDSARAWAVEHGLELDEELRDEGVSGFRGANTKDEAALGTFLQAVNAGDVPRGSYLVVESLDRLSRDRLLAAQSILINLLLAGINVVTLSDGRTYSEASVNANPIDLIASLLVFMRANEESETKAKRLRASWSARRARAVESGARMTTNGPAWLRAAGDGWEIIPERRVIIERIFRETLDGAGQHRIAQTLTLEGVPTWDGGKVWHRTYVRKLLENPSVRGELVAYVTERLGGGGRVRRPVETVPGYYPAVIDEELWTRTRAFLGSKAEASPGRGRHSGGAVRNILAGIARCPVCGSTMTRVNKGPRGGAPRLVCTLAKAGGDCVYHAVNLATVEDAIWSRGHELVEGAPASTDSEAKALDALRSVEADIEMVIEERQALDGQRRRGGGKVERQLSAELIRRQQALEDKRDALRADVAAASTGLVRSRLERLEQALADGPQEDRKEVNLAMREALRSVVVEYGRGVLALSWRHGGTTEFFYDYSVSLPRP